MRRSMIIFIKGLTFVTTICLWLLSTPVAALPGDMGGVYDLGGFFSQNELSKEEVTGLSLRGQWEDIEPQKGYYDWSYLDTNIQKAIDNNKKVMIRVIAGQYTPDWVYDEGAKAFTYIEDGATLTMPLPWDKVYLRYWNKFIQELGYRYRNLPNLVTVQMTGPCESGEMHLADKGNQTAWLAAGYTDIKILNAWKKVINAYNSAFPTTPLGISIATPVSFKDTLNVVQSVLGYAYVTLGTRLRVQGNWLSADTSETFDLYQIVEYYSNYTNVGFQMLCSATDTLRFGGTLRQAIDIGLAAGASYLEIYGTDIVNPDYATDIQYADYNLKLQEKF